MRKQGKTDEQITSYIMSNDPWGSMSDENDWFKRIVKNTKESLQESERQGKIEVNGKSVLK